VIGRNDWPTASIELYYRTIIYYQLLQQETRVNVLMLVKQFTVSVQIR